MRTAILLGLLAVMMAIPRDAQAKRAAMVEEETLSFAASTSIDSETSERLSLCVRSITNKLFGMVPIWTRRDYVLAPQRCENSIYYETTPGELGVARTRGQIPRSTPNTPPLTIEGIIQGFWGLGGLGVLLIAAIARITRKEADKVEYQREKLPEDFVPPDQYLGQGDTMAKVAAKVMIAAAQVDGPVTEGKFMVIQDVINMLSPDALREETIFDIVNYITPPTTRKDLARLVRGMDAEDRMDLMGSAVMVVSADDAPSKAEQKFLKLLAKAFELDREQMVEVVGRVNEMIEQA